MSSLKSLEVKSILESIDKASDYTHNSYDWSDIEWEWIINSLKNCDDEILKLRQENDELKKEIERLKEYEFMYKSLDK